MFVEETKAKHIQDATVWWLQSIMETKATFLGLIMLQYSKDKQTIKLFRLLSVKPSHDSQSNKSKTFWKLTLAKTVMPTIPNKKLYN